MQLKITLAVLLALRVLVLVPAARADTIRAPAQPVFDNDAIASVLAHSVNEALPFDNDWAHNRGHDHDPDPVTMPEPTSMAPFILLAAGVLLFRKP